MPIKAAGMLVCAVQSSIQQPTCFDKGEVSEHLLLQDIIVAGHGDWVEQLDSTKYIFRQA